MSSNSEPWPASRLHGVLLRLAIHLVGIFRVYLDLSRIDVVPRRGESSGMSTVPPNRRERLHDIRDFQISSRRAVSAFRGVS